jgi:hypothetical protein
MKRKPRICSCRPMKALAVACLLLGDVEGKLLKRIWDRRKTFYPMPIKRGRRVAGQPSLYDPRELIAAAVAAGDVSAAQARQALDVLDGLCSCHAPSTPPLTS